MKQRFQMLTITGKLTAKLGSKDFGVSATVIDTVTGAEMATFRSEDQWGGLGSDDMRAEAVKKAKDLCRELNREDREQAAA